MDAGLVRVKVLAPVVVKERTVFAPAVVAVPPLATTNVLFEMYCIIELAER